MGSFCLLIKASADPRGSETGFISQAKETVLWWHVQDWGTKSTFMLFIFLLYDFFHATLNEVQFNSVTRVNIKHAAHHFFSLNNSSKYRSSQAVPYFQNNQTKK